MRVVVDTNVWVSYLLRPRNPLVEELDRLVRSSKLLYSRDTLSELVTVLTRSRFATYIDPEDVLAFATELSVKGEEVVINRQVRACRDPADDKFLELAVCGRADLIISGDSDLLDLHPFESIQILQVGAAARLLGD